MLIEKDNFINDEFCDYLINYHKANFNKKYRNKDKWAMKHRNTQILTCEAEAIEGNSYFKILLSSLNFLVQTHFKNTFINYSQIVRWPNKQKQNEHLDFDYHSHTSILYLNDDYKGGETVVGDKVIKPKKGKIFLFEGNKIKHQVLQIRSGIRYTNPTWYMMYEKEKK